MAEQSVTLNPGESKLVSFEAIPHEARVFQVSVNGLTGSFKATAAPEGWVSPTGDNGLYNASKARDGDFETYAVIRSEAWSDFLVLTIEPTVCSAISYLMSFSHPSYAAVGLDIDIEYDGTWHNLLDAGPATLPDLSGRLNVITFQPQTITGVRIRAKGCGYPRIFYLREVQLWRGTGLAAEAEFEYVSDVRIKPWPEATSSPNAIFEVDVKNVGNSLGICSGTIYLDTSLQYNTVPISSGLDLIKPGETRTLQAKWQAGAGWSEDDWYFPDSGYIETQAGCISYKFGRSIYPVSFVPSQITSGSIVTAKAVFHLAAGRKWYDSSISPTTGKPFGLTGDFFRVKLPNKVITVHALYPGVDVPDLGYISFGDMLLLPYASDYTFEFPLGPLSPGIYDIIATLQWSYQAAAFAPWHVRLLGWYKVGQVQVI
jgi:hypothetical protein